MIRGAIVILLVLCVAGSAAFRLYTEARVRAEEAEISRLERERSRLQAEVERLGFEVEVLESAPRLGELSADRLRLKPSSAEQVADGETLKGVLDPAATPAAEGDE